MPKKNEEKKFNQLVFGHRVGFFMPNHIHRVWGMENEYEIRLSIFQSILEFQHPYQFFAEFRKLFPTTIFYFAFSSPFLISDYETSVISIIICNMQ